MSTKCVEYGDKQMVQYNIVIIGLRQKKAPLKSMKNEP